MKKALAILATIGSIGAVASANAAEIYSQIGTEGIGLGAGTALNDSVGLRAEFNYGSLNHDFTVSEIDYDAKVKPKAAGVYGDWFPTLSAFRLTAGLNFNKSRVNATGTSDTTLTINGQQYSAAGEAVYATIKWPSVMPYVGVGFGHGAAEKGWGLFADIGVMVGKPKASLSASPGLLAQVSSDQLEAERRKLQDKADDFRVYPVLKIGVSYAF
jgi:hypothetical protein